MSHAVKQYAGTAVISLSGNTGPIHIARAESVPRVAAPAIAEKPVTVSAVVSDGGIPVRRRRHRDDPHADHVEE